MQADEVARFAREQEAARGQREAVRELVQRFESMFVRALPGQEPTG